MEPWCIAFFDRIHIGPRWWDIFTTPGFRHCLAFRQICDGICLVIEPTMYGMNVSLRECESRELVAEAQAKGGRVLVTNSRIPPSVELRRGPLVTCASVVAYCVGISSRAVTPKGLYNHLVQDGATELWAA